MTAPHTPEPETPEPETPELETPEPEAVRARNVTKSFNGRPILSGFNLSLRPNEFVALLGASGSGKTTFLRILSGLESADSGEVLTPRRRTVVFQEPRLVAGRRVAANVSLGQRATRATRRAASEALAEVGLAGRERAWPTTLSGGEAQRVALARALVRSPELLLLDEPFAALDALTRIRMQALVAEVQARHRPAVLLVTHDVDEAILLADRVIVLREGRVGAEYTVDFPRPRRRGVPGFGDFRRRLLLDLGVEEAIGAAQT